MQAVIWTGYGSPEVLQPGVVEKPTPGDHEVLIKIKAASVSAGDCEMRSLDLAPWLRWALRFYIGILKPRRIQILGQELAGEVVQIGQRVTCWQVGDLVFGTPGLGLGGYAEYIRLPEVPGEAQGALARKPENLSFEEAAALPVGGLEALHFLRRAAVQPGEKVLIIGAGGSIGGYGIQLAGHYGAEVTGVDRTDKLEHMRSLGADRVIDYTQEDFSRSGEWYDVVFDVIGAASLKECAAVLAPGGRCLLVNPGLRDFIQGRRLARNGQQLITGTAPQTTEGLEQLADLVGAGVIRPALDRTFALEEAAEAHRYHDSGAKQGNLVLTVPHN